MLANGGTSYDGPDDDYVLKGTLRRICGRLFCSVADACAQDRAEWSIGWRSRVWDTRDLDTRLSAG